MAATTFQEDVNKLFETFMKQNEIKSEKKKDPHAPLTNEKLKKKIVRNSQTIQSIPQSSPSIHKNTYEYPFVSLKGSHDDRKRNCERPSRQITLNFYHRYSSSIISRITDVPREIKIILKRALPRNGFDNQQLKGTLSIGKKPKRQKHPPRRLTKSATARLASTSNIISPKRSHETKQSSETKSSSSSKHVSDINFAECSSIKDALHLISERQTSTRIKHCRPKHSERPLSDKDKFMNFKSSNSKSKPSSSTSESSMKSSHDSAINLAKFSSLQDALNAINGRQTSTSTKQRRLTKGRNHQFSEASTRHVTVKIKLEKQLPMESGSGEQSELHPEYSTDPFPTKEKKFLKFKQPRTSSDREKTMSSTVVKSKEKQNVPKVSNSQSIISFNRKDSKRSKEKDNIPTESEMIIPEAPLLPPIKALKWTGSRSSTASKFKKGEHVPRVSKTIVRQELTSPTMKPLKTKKLGSSTAGTSKIASTSMIPQAPPPPRISDSSTANKSKKGESVHTASKVIIPQAPPPIKSFEKKRSDSPTKRSFKEKVDTANKVIIPEAPPPPPNKSIQKKISNTSTTKKYAKTENVQSIIKPPPPVKSLKKKRSDSSTANKSEKTENVYIAKKSIIKPPPSIKSIKKKRSDSSTARRFKEKVHTANKVIIPEAPSPPPIKSIKKKISDSSTANKSEKTENVYITNKSIIKSPPPVKSLKKKRSDSSIAGKSKKRENINISSEVLTPRALPFPSINYGDGMEIFGAQTASRSKAKENIPIASEIADNQETTPPPIKSLKIKRSNSSIASKYKEKENVHNVSKFILQQAPLPPSIESLKIKEIGTSTASWFKNIEKVPTSSELITPQASSPPPILSLEMQRSHSSFKMERSESLTAKYKEKTNVIKKINQQAPSLPSIKSLKIRTSSTERSKKEDVSTLTEVIIPQAPPLPSIKSLKMIGTHSSTAGKSKKTQNIPKSSKVLIQPPTLIKPLKIKRSKFLTSNKSKDKKNVPTASKEIIKKIPGTSTASISEEIKSDQTKMIFLHAQSPQAHSPPPIKSLKIRNSGTSTTRWSKRKVRKLKVQKAPPPPLESKKLPLSTTNSYHKKHNRKSTDTELRKRQNFTMHKKYAEISTNNELRKRQNSAKIKKPKVKGVVKKMPLPSIANLYNKKHHHKYTKASQSSPNDSLEMPRIRITDDEGNEKSLEVSHKKRKRRSRKIKTPGLLSPPKPSYRKRKRKHKKRRKRKLKKLKKKNTPSL